MKKILFLVLLTGLFNHSYAQQANSKSTATNTVKMKNLLPLTLYSIPMKMWLLNIQLHIKGRKYLIKQRRVLCQFGMKMESDCGTILYLLWTFRCQRSCFTPISISFNGGPGSASVWCILHTGPTIEYWWWRISITTFMESKENPHSILEGRTKTHKDTDNFLW
jgi:hypothetical protein